ncbi:hypothetical protein cypCar_00012827 [Cyprinus carpio]|nr:hypothetical protein cypCar_00012827 [Cyprinus carpio]
MVINSRTFKTFDALLDALSKKVPLPFGVRTITTPRGTHVVRTLDDVQDGGSYLCSDQKKVKPFNLDEVHKRQVPWNTTRPVSAGRQARRELVRQLVKRNEVTTRAGKMAENAVVIRTPKRLTVYKNRDPSMKRVVVLHRRTAPSFKALLDYLSQVMQFPVVKLFTEDGRRRFLVEQINKSLNGNLAELNRTNNESMETEGSQPVGSDEMETCDCTDGVEKRNYPIMPTEDDIEKSFRVNEDGSMTVEMKVHLTIKQEEMIHWTTTLSRISVNNQQRAVCNSKPQSGGNSLDVTNDSGKESNGPHSLDSKEINTHASKSVGFTKEEREEEREHYGSDTSSEKPKSIYRRLPTPGPRQQRKEASVETIKTISETEVQESTVGAYSYMERTAQGELTEGYCVVSHNSSSSTRTVSKPGKSELGEVKKNKSDTSFRSSGVAQILQLQNNGTMGITETVMHIYESQGTCDNYNANTQVYVDSKPGYHTKALPQSKPGSTDSGPRSSSNDCDVDLTRKSPSSNSQDGGKSDMLSLSSACSTPPKKKSNNPSILTDDEKQTLVDGMSEMTEKEIIHPAAAMEQVSDDKSIEGLVRMHKSSENLAPPDPSGTSQSTEVRVSIKDEDELKASLTSLQSSTSSKLKQSWRDFQEQNVFEESPPLSPRFSEQEFAVEVDLEGETEDQDKQCSFSIEQLLDELNMPEDLHTEISSLVEGEIQYFNQEDVIKHDDTISEISGKEKENEDGSLSGSLEKAADMEEEKENIDQDSDKTNDQMEPESQELCLIQAHSPDSETIDEDMGNEDSGIAVPIQSPEGNGSDSSKAEVLETSDNNQMSAENMQVRVMHEDSESENKDGDGNRSPTSEQKITDVAVEEVSELSDHQDNICDREDNVMAEIIEERDTDVEEEDSIQNIRVTSKQSDASEPEDTNAKCSCSGLETECVPFSDREAPELNEDNQQNTVEDCVREEAELSDSEETISDGGHEQENKSISSKCISIHSETSSPHCDTEGESREQTLESSSQEDDQVMSPDVKDEDQQEDVPEISEGEDPDPHCNSSPQYGSNDENSMTPEAEYMKTQQIENGLVEEHDINEVDHENSEVCERVDPDAEPDSCTISDPEVADEDVTETKPNTSDSEPCKVQILEKGNQTKKDSSAEECDVEEEDLGSLDSHNSLNSVRHSCTDNKDSVEGESYGSISTSEHQFEKAESLGMEHGYHYLLHPTEISQELLDLINSALLSSTLTVKCDSNGNLRIEPDKHKMRDMFMACQKIDNQYGQKCLPSPNTSDLSDYRPETSDNGGYQSQELFTESGEEEAERLRIFREIIKRSSEKPKRINHVKESGLMKSSTWMTTKPTPSPSLKSSSLASFQDAKSAIQETVSHSRSPSDKSSLDGNYKSVQCMALKDNVDSGEGVLIDKGRWLLKENHLIRNSPPVTVGMYRNGDTTSADTAQDNRSEDSAYPYCENQASHLAVISSSELEDMAKPPTPKCTYFKMAHSSDSDPLLDAQSVNSGSGGGNARRNKELKVKNKNHPYS